MDDLNQFAISKLLNSSMRDVGDLGFGRFSTFAARSEYQKTLQGPTFKEDLKSSDSLDALIVKAFEEVRGPADARAATDELLWNVQLTTLFVDKCRELSGLLAKKAFFVRRLINVRKNPGSYGKKGIKIEPATKKEVHASIVPRFAHVIEFSLVKLRYRYGASIDDILMSDELGNSFERVAHQIEPSLSAVDLRLGALSIRKNRGTRKSEILKLDELDPSLLSRSWSPMTPIPDVKVKSIPHSPGLVELKENEKYLYISHNDDIREAVGQLTTGSSFKLFGSHFWKPRPEELKIAYILGDKIAGSSTKMWERKLVRDFNPLFNWPMVHEDAGQS
jgi:hypothetical protein